jgi:hypothetical protein
MINDADNTEDPEIPARYTIPKIYRDVFLSVVMGFAMEARARDVIIDEEEGELKAAMYEKLALKHFSRLEDVTTAGTST